MTLLKLNSHDFEFAQFRIRYEFARIQIEFEANLHPQYSFAAEIFAMGYFEAGLFRMQS